MTTIGRYDHFAMLLHWLMALFILLMLGLGWYMEDLPKGSPERSWFFALHKSIGLSLALLVVVRLCWRLLPPPPPPLPEELASWQKRGARGVHFLLYLSMFVQPVSGYLSSSFSGYKTRFWGIPLPDWGWKSPELNEFFTEIHEISSVLLVALIVCHILAVIVHVKRGEVHILQRMTPPIRKA